MIIQQEDEGFLVKLQQSLYCLYLKCHKLIKILRV